MCWNCDDQIKRLHLSTFPKSKCYSIYPLKVGLLIRCIIVICIICICSECTHMPKMKLNFWLVNVVSKSTDNNGFNIKANPDSFLSVDDTRLHKVGIILYQWSLLIYCFYFMFRCCLPNIVSLICSECTQDEIKLLVGQCYIKAYRQQWFQHQS